MNRAPIYVINLQGSRARFQKLQTRFGKFGQKVTRVAAVNGKKVLPSRTTVNLRHPGERGCALSHRKVAQKLLSSRSKFCIVLEDDACPTEALPRTRREINQKLKPYKTKLGMCDIIYLQRMKTCNGRVTGGYGTYGMILTKSGARKILQVTRGCKVPIDHAIIGHSLPNETWARTSGCSARIVRYAITNTKGRPYIIHKPCDGSVINRIGGKR